MKQPKRLENVAFGREGRESHLRERLGDADERFQVAHRDRDATALPRLGLVVLRVVAHLHVLGAQLLADFGGQPGSTAPETGSMRACI